MPELVLILLAEASLGKLSTNESRTLRPESYSTEINPRRNVDNLIFISSGGPPNLLNKYVVFFQTLLGVSYLMFNI